MFAIFGAGGCGRDLLRAAQEMLGLHGRDDLVFVEDNPTGPVLGVPVISPADLSEDAEVVIAIGTSQGRREIAERLNAKWGMLISPKAIVGPGVEIGEGATVSDFAAITCSTRIGRHFQCNIYSYVGHDCLIGDFVTFAPRVGISGNVHIGNGVYIGTGAIIKQGTPGNPRLIGENSFIGMGAVVNRDVPPGAKVVGNPARQISRTVLPFLVPKRRARH